MSINSYRVGKTVRVKAAFTDSAGVAGDPTGVTVIWVDPAGVTTTWVFGTDAEVVKDSTGNYHADIPTATHGRYKYRVAGTGVIATAEEGEFVVEPNETD